MEGCGCGCGVGVGVKPERGVGVVGVGLRALLSSLLLPHHAVRAAAHRLGQLAALVVPDVAWRGEGDWEGVGKGPLARAALALPLLSLCLFFS